MCFETVVAMSREHAGPSCNTCALNEIANCPSSVNAYRAMTKADPGQDVHCQQCECPFIDEVHAAQGRRRERRREGERTNKRRRVDGVRGRPGETANGIRRDGEGRKWGRDRGRAEMVGGGGREGEPKPRISLA
jgi:hypothetical protein